ncbi:hypothetical protein GJ496_003885 [Pomphorhynchus laevis]|nr:hypothetical protein GJ496_003885 [Pomphorhynchus laevis]
MKENIPFKSLEELDLHAEQCISKSAPKTVLYHHYYELADLYYKMGAFAKARSYLEILIREGTSSVRVLSLYGDCVSLLGRSIEDIDGTLVSLNKSVLSEMNSSSSDIESYYDALQSPLSNSPDNTLDRNVEMIILDKLRSVEIGDDPLNALADLDREVSIFEQNLGSNSTVMLYLVQMSFMYISSSEAKKSLIYCNRLLQQIRNGRNVIPTEYLTEAKYNLALCILFGLMSLDNVTSLKFAWCAEYISKHLQEPYCQNLMNKDNPWRRIVIERFLFTHLWKIHLQRNCSNLFNTDSHDTDNNNVFDSNTISMYKPLYDFLAELRTSPLSEKPVFDSNSVGKILTG